MKKFAAILSGAAVAMALLWSAAAAQEAVNWSGPYAAGFGQYSSGISTQNDNGFVYNPPRSQPVAAPRAAAGGAGGGGGGGGGGAAGGGTAAGSACTATAECAQGLACVAGTCAVNNPNAGGDARYSVSGGFGGGAVGYNYQWARAVFGLEGSIAGGRASGSSAFCGTPAHECGTNVDAIADVRGRLGYSFGRLLPFVAGGLAVDHLAANDSLFGAQGKGWLAGYTVGAGLEYKLTSHLSIRAEYLHTDIRPQVLFDIVRNVPERVGYCSQAVRVGLSYSLNPGLSEPVVAR